MSSPGLIAFDLDGTLVRIGSAWSWIHRLLGTLDAAKPYAEQYYAGEINYERWAQLDVKLWHGTPISRIKKAIQQELAFIPNADKLLSRLNSHGFKTAIISSGLAIFADKAKEALEIDISRANQLIIDDQGRISGVDVHVAFDNKHQILHELADCLEIPLAKCAAIGDSRNDIPMFKVAGFSIAFNPTHEEVAQAATTIVQGEDALELLPPLEWYFNIE
ncbi:MAG: HAD family hydrolase [Candidatus Thorarchaeota archaeon]